MDTRQEVGTNSNKDQRSAASDVSEDALIGDPLPKTGNDSHFG